MSDSRAWSSSARCSSTNSPMASSAWGEPPSMWRGNLKGFGVDPLFISAVGGGGGRGRDPGADGRLGDAHRRGGPGCRTAPAAGWRYASWRGSPGTRSPPDRRGTGSRAGCWSWTPPESRDFSTMERWLSEGNTTGTSLRSCWSAGRHVPIWTSIFVPPGGPTRLVEGSVARATWVRMNEGELALLGPGPGGEGGAVEEQAARLARRHGLERLVVTRGASGRWRWWRGKGWWSPPAPGGRRRWTRWARGTPSAPSTSWGSSGDGRRRWRSGGANLFAADVCRIQGATPSDAPLQGHEGAGPGRRRRIREPVAPGSPAPPRSSGTGASTSSP